MLVYASCCFFLELSFGYGKGIFLEVLFDVTVNAYVWVVGCFLFLFF